ncbi:Cgl0159 family (beta/alpha)8-fold protein [Nocardia niigatensis]|uniref:Cgl0159 family (beta/alpha)8-fold protein n=1 Tax=Nocardia niigatensis TaxID=209249 RepID=UPI00030B3D48|nr:aldolase [Nocardia niigatensis]
MHLTDARWDELLQTRATDPEAVRRAYADRRRRPNLLSDRGTLFLVAADHPARGALGVGADRTAMADRRTLLERLLIALDNPAVDGVLGSPDIVEELLLLDAVHEKIVIGSMNRGGLAGADWEIDDRFTGYDAESLVKFRLDGGKMLLRLVDSDPGTIPTLEACARAVSELAEHGLMAMVEPLPYARDASGTLTMHKDAAALQRAITVASGLGVTSAYTWLKIPAPEDVSVLDATTLPVVVLGGAPSGDPESDLASWGSALRHDVARGLVVGRSLLYPPDGNVAGAVHAAAQVLEAAR